MNKLQLQRGTQTEIDTYNATPSAGEPTWTTDTNKLYVGGVPVGVPPTTTLTTTDAELIAAPYKQGDVRVLVRPLPEGLQAGDTPPVGVAALEYHDGTYKAIVSETTTGDLAHWELISSTPAHAYYSGQPALIATPYNAGDIRSMFGWGTDYQYPQTRLCLVSRAAGDPLADDTDWATMSINKPDVLYAEYSVIGTAVGEMLETPYFQGDLRTLADTVGTTMAGLYIANTTRTPEEVGNINDFSIVSPDDYGELV